MNYVLGAIAIAYGLALVSLCWNLRQTIRLVKGPAAGLPATAEAGAYPRLDVVIPVKDEESRIGTCIESALAQDYPHFRLVVVNDRSTDGTGRVLADMAERHARIHAVDVADLPTGQFGKPHALATVSGLLSADVLLFMDSDVHIKPGCFRIVVNQLMSRPLDWLAIMGAPELVLFWERMLVPLFGALAYAWYDPRAISDPNSSVAIGSGFMAVRRTAYEAVGGHQAVVREYDEDSALLRLAKKLGQRVSYDLCPDLYSVRFYGSFQKTIHGMTRTCVGGIKTLPRMLVTIGAVNFVALLPMEILAGLGLARHWNVSVPWTPLWIGMAGFHWSIACALCWLIYDRAHSSRWFSFLHPVGAAVVIAVCVKAARMLVSRGPITWRGTTY